MSNKSKFKSLIVELLNESDETRKQEKVINIINTFKSAQKDEFLDQKNVDDLLLELQTELKKFAENDNAVNRDSLKLQYLFISDLIVN